MKYSEEIQRMERVLGTGVLRNIFRKIRGFRLVLRKVKGLASRKKCRRHGWGYRSRAPQFDFVSHKIKLEGKKGWKDRARRPLNSWARHLGFIL